ncbi:hypothetical protein ACFWNK_15185 [Streptomyces sp. NPDC058417]|uniref:hypothetical protein n=1 Tax=unclassified Streptomyces TaxID=2593676 RepID=UPI0036644676
MSKYAHVRGTSARRRSTQTARQGRGVAAIRPGRPTWLSQAGQFGQFGQFSQVTVRDVRPGPGS